MIVRDIMTVRLITVAPDDTLSHVANVLRQHQFHHLPVVRHVEATDEQEGSGRKGRGLDLLEGLITAQDIDLLVALAKQSSSGDVLRRPWQEQPVAEIMSRATIRVTPTTSVAAAAQLMVARGLSSLPVVEYEEVKQKMQTALVGLITRSDMLLALARSLGANEPGMQLVLPLPGGKLAPLAQALQFADELHIQVRSILAAPLEGKTPHTATLRLGTINPAPFLFRLQEANIHYTFAGSLAEGETDG